MQPRRNTCEIGDTVVSVVDGERGTVVSLEREGAGVVFINWRGGEFPVAYPGDTNQIRKPYPWEK